VLNTITPYPIQLITSIIKINCIPFYRYSGAPVTSHTYGSLSSQSVSRQVKLLLRSPFTQTVELNTNVPFSPMFSGPKLVSLIQLLMSITLRSNHLILLIGTKQVLAQKTSERMERLCLIPLSVCAQITGLVQVLNTMWKG
jgi:hypothetical protein